MLYKRYVDVEALIDREGRIIPKVLYWEGIRYEIDKILGKPKQSASEVGGCGLLFVIQVHGSERKLFFDNNLR